MYKRENVVQFKAGHVNRADGRLLLMRRRRQQRRWKDSIEARKTLCRNVE